MAEWKIDPITFVTNNNDGTFVFAENDTTEERNYIITYTDNQGRTATSTYKVPTGDCGCNCDKLKIPSPSVSFTNSETTTDKEVEYTKGECINNITAEWKDNESLWFAYEINNDNIIISRIFEGNSEFSVNTQLYIKYNANTQDTCTSAITVTQTGTIPESRRIRLKLNGCCDGTDPADPYCGESYYIIFIKNGMDTDEHGNIIYNSSYYDWHVDINQLYTPGQNINITDIRNIMYNYGKEYIYMENKNPSATHIGKIMAYPIRANQAGNYPPEPTILGEGTDINTILNLLKNNQTTAEVDCNR